MVAAAHKVCQAYKAPYTAQAVHIPFDKAADSAASDYFHMGASQNTAAGLHKVVCFADSGNWHSDNFDTAVAADADNSDVAVDLHSEIVVLAAGEQNVADRHLNNSASSAGLQAAQDFPAQ